MNSKLIRQRFLQFFKDNNHHVLPSTSLVPENETDNSVLFNTAGVQPIVPYILAGSHPKGSRLASIQKCLRTNDIDDIGDNTHATFFEMMGNWSIGDYFKKEAINFSFKLLIEGFELNPARLYVTVFEGDENASRDEYSYGVWAELFKSAGQNPEHHIFYMSAKTNWWPQPKADDTYTGPTGPDTEMFYDVIGTTKITSKSDFIAADDAQHIVEIWNDVFMEFRKENGKIVGKLEKQNVDTGSGFERIAMVLQGKNNIFDTDIFEPVMRHIQENSTDFVMKKARIVADHMRSATFLISDGVIPTNSDRGYILRRLIRRAVVNMRAINFTDWRKIVDLFVEQYKDVYSHLNAPEIIKIISEEESKFVRALDEGLKQFEKIVTSTKTCTPEDVFNLYQNYGFPIEMTAEMAREKGITVDIKSVTELIHAHQEISKKGSEQKFKGGLSGTGTQETKYHTATHLLHQALRDVLGEHIGQKGSNINPERLRFDFSHTAKMTDEEKQKVESIVNEKIRAALPVNKIILPKEQAIKTGAIHFFAEKYGDEVSVYYIGDNIESAYSKEFCGGPHVSNTNELGVFKIAKEEAVSAGVRRIKATLS